MELPLKLQQEIINFLMSLPNIHDNDSQRSLIYQAGLDSELQAQIQFNKPLIHFILFLLSTLLNYGYLKDGRFAIVALLEATKCLIGEDKKVYCDILLQQLYPMIKSQYQEFSNTITNLKIYHNLPQPDYGQFIGREKELTKIKEILSPYPKSQYHGVIIDGIGGIGKTSLALEVAHQYLRDYNRFSPEERFEAIIWTSAKQSVLTADGITIRRQILRTLDDIYNAIATTLQREDITRTTPKEQERIVRQTLTDQRVLIIVDNLETIDDESVMAFLQELPAPTKVVVTTRHYLNFGYRVRLSGMPSEDSYILIQQECEKKGVALDSENIQHLYNRTGGVPLAIVWSIAQMGFGYEIEVVLTRLGQPTSDLAKFCFEGALNGIKGKAPYKLLMALSLAKESVCRETLGYVTKLPELDRDEGLVKLERLSLANKQGNQFSLLPLTKQFARSDFYVELGELKRAEILGRQSQSLYHKLDDPKGECFALSYLGRVFRRAGRYKEAEETFKNAMNLATKYDYGDGRAYIHFEWGKLYREQEEWEKAKEHYQEAVIWCEKSNKADLDVSFLNATQGNLGWVEFKIGSSQHNNELILQGKQRIEESIRYFEDGGKGNAATLRIRLAKIEDFLGNRIKSIEYAKEALFLANHLNMGRESQEARKLLEDT